METFQLPSLPALLAFVALVFTLWKFCSNPAVGRSKKLLPGPRKLPIIGNFHQFISEPLAHRAMAKLARKYGPIMHLQLGQVSSIFISSPELAKQVLRTHDQILASRPHTVAAEILLYNFADVAFAPYGESWRHMRKICIMEFLSPKRVLSFRPIREEDVSKVIGEISFNARNPINLTKMLQSMVHKVVLRALIGKADDEQAGRYANLANQIVVALDGSGVAEFFPSIKFLPVLTGTRSKLNKIRKEGDEILDKVIRERLEVRRKLPIRRDTNDDGHKDMLHALLDLLDHGELQSTDNVKASIQDMIIAGTDTTSTTMEWVMVEMIRNPDVLDKATKEVRGVFKKRGKVDEADLQELTYMKLVIQETLRLHPAAPMLVPRESMERCEIDGYEIPAKSRIFVNVWAINRDPNYWKDPETFFPERFQQEKEIPFDYKGTIFEYLPFGSGRRICPEIAFGLNMLEFGIASLLYNFDWKLPNGQRNEDINVHESPGLAIRRTGYFHVIPIPYNH